MGFKFTQNIYGSHTGIMDISRSLTVAIKLQQRVTKGSEQNHKHAACTGLPYAYPQ